MSPLACFTARLLALEKPVFSVCHIKITSLNLSLKKALLPSVEQLSTTNISASILAQALITETRHCSKKYCTL
jgi:hypothetical protein